ncbi:MAG: hypothetical protein KDC92_05080 [Bacteroidetes bacterium]|nr:hypothetical protein [Bacteroidota bacterium]
MVFMLISNFTPSPQEKPYWCWAAVTEMIAKQQISQENIVKSITNNESNNLANFPYKISLIHTNVSMNAFQHKHGLSCKELKNQILANRIVAFEWLMDGRSNTHIQLIVGLIETKNETLLLTYDPLPVEVGQLSLIPYEVYNEPRLPTGRNTHYSLKYTYFNFKNGERLIPFNADVLNLSNQRIKTSFSNQNLIDEITDYFNSINSTLLDLKRSFGYSSSSENEFKIELSSELIYFNPQELPETIDDFDIIVGQILKTSKTLVIFKNHKVEFVVKLFRISTEDDWDLFQIILGPKSRLEEFESEEYKVIMSFPNAGHSQDIAPILSNKLRKTKKIDDYLYRTELYNNLKLTVKN